MDAINEQGPPTRELARPEGRGRRGWRRLGPYLGAVAITALALGLALLIQSHANGANVALIFLGGVVVSATRWGMRPALLACALSVAALNFFFFPPLHDLSVEDPENILAVAIFVAVAILVGRLTTQARADAQLADNRARVMAELYAFARQLTSCEDLDGLLQLTARALAGSVKVEVVVLVPEQGVPTLRAAWPAIEELDAEDMAAAERALARADADLMGTVGERSSRSLFLPLRGATATVGVVGLGRHGRPPLFSSDERRLIEAMTDHVAVAIQRLTLAAEVEQARVAAETEGLRSAMLSAISHDLKTPLASILGAATSLGTYSSYFEEQQREELVATIREEAERMSRFVGNLLDITRVESGTLEVRSEATDIEEVIGAAVRRARRVAGQHRLQLRVAADLPLLDLDGVLLEQALFNLLDNAAKYSPPHSTIAVEAKRIGDRLLIKVIDEGPGVRPQDQRRIFEKFYRAGPPGRQRAGTGLGLAICRGFVSAMGGRIIAGNRTDRSGAVFMIGFPLPRRAPAPALTVIDDD